MKGTISAPNIGFKKLLLKRFEILEVNEYNTSKLYNKTFKELENVSVRKNKHKKHLHEILTPKEETERCIFVNRDKNACKNILYLGKYFLRNQSRPIEFCQKTKEKIVVKQRKPRQNLKTSEFLNNDDKKSKILLSQKKELVV
jgi:ribosomal protein L24E